jgi:hypothetical protein
MNKDFDKTLGRDNYTYTSSFYRQDCLLLETEISLIMCSVATDLHEHEFRQNISTWQQYIYMSFFPTKLFTIRERDSSCHV